MIMLVENDFDQVHDLIDLFRQEGIEVCHAISFQCAGEEAIALARQKKPLLIIMDIVLGATGLDGISTAKEIRQFLPDVPILFRTVFSTHTLPPAFRSRLLEIPNHQLIPKNGRVKDLVDIVRLKLPRRTKLFVCYSREDKDFVTELQEHLRASLKPLCDYFIDVLIEDGSDWRRAIDNALATACAGVLLVSPTFCSSSFITEEELPRLQEAAEKEYLRLFPVLVRDTAQDALKKARLDSISFVGNSFANPWIHLSKPNRQRKWCELVDKVIALLRNAT